MIYYETAPILRLWNIRMEAVMAKHVAYPCLIASFFFKFGGIGAKCAENFPPNPEKGMAIFRQYTTKYTQDQEFSPGDESPIASQDDEWLSSGLSSESSETLSIGSYGSDKSDNEESEQHIWDRRIFAPSITTIPADSRSALYIKHLQMWIDNIEKYTPKTAEDHRNTFLSSFPTGYNPEDIYRQITFESSENTHLYAPGLTPVKGTPRRKNNIHSLSEGKSAIWIDPRTDRQYRCHMHHLGQINHQTYIVMLPVDIHRLPGVHTYHGPSKIDRSEFAQERRNGRQMLAKQLFPTSPFKSKSLHFSLDSDTDDNESECAKHQNKKACYL